MAEPAPRIRGLVLTVIKDGVVFEGSTSVSALKDIYRLVNGLKRNLNQYYLSGENLNLKSEEKIVESFKGNTGSDLPLREKLEQAQKIIKEIKSLDGSVVMRPCSFQAYSVRRILHQPQ